MTLLETTPDPADLLAFVDESVRALQDGGLEPRYILIGPEAYGRFCRAIAERFGRGAGAFESYQYLPIVVDPFRGGAVCVVPAPREAADVRGERLD